MNNKQENTYQFKKIFLSSIIIQAISTTLEKAPVEVVSDIIKNGIYLAGGGAQIRNLDN